MIKIIQDLSILRMVSSMVKSVEETLPVIKDLEEILNSIDNGIGLAAIQIGIPKQIGVIRHKDGSFVHLINSEIIDQEDEFIFFNEGCLSCPGIFRSTKRYKHLTIKNYRIEDNRLEEEKLYFYYSKDSYENGNDGLLAIAVQHEIDHFRGKMILDYDIKSQPFCRETSKIGRNEPCFCGSGKKYKKCCGR